MNALIFAAGLGTRLRPLTDHKPKALVEVGGQTLLERTLRTLIAAGADHIVVNAHHFADQIIDFIGSREWPVPVVISDESAKLLDTGGGLRKALTLCPSDEPLLIHNVDILSNADLPALIESHRAHFSPLGGQWGASLLVSKRNSTRQLYFHPETLRLMGWQNLTTGETRSPYPDFRPEECLAYAFSGIHCVSPSIADAMSNEPEAFPIMDFYIRHCHELPIYAYPADNLRLLDVGKLDSIRQAEEFLQNA